MRRRHYIVTYDISDDKRRNDVFRTLYGYGDHAQYSVFFCELNREELARLRQRLRNLIHHTEDQILIVELGPAVRSLHVALEVLGKHYAPSIRTIVV